MEINGNGCLCFYDDYLFMFEVVGIWVYICANVHVSSVARRSAWEALQVWLGVDIPGSMKVTDCECPFSILFSSRTCSFFYNEAPFLKWLMTQLNVVIVWPWL